MRSRGSSNYDDYDDFYYGESTENDYYYGNSQYEGHEVSDYDRSGICEVSFIGFGSVMKHLYW